MTLITDSDVLAAFCARQASASYIAVDTEFLRDTSYWPKLCLVQVAGPQDAAVIDVLAPDLDIAPLLELMRRDEVIKAFHSARQDLEIFFNLMGDVPAPLFDTQVAAMVCGFGDSIGYDALARRLTGTRIDKGSRFTDWSHRPLTQRQIDYALSDVVHLRPIYEQLVEQLEQSGRAHWLEDEMAVLRASETYRLEPRRAWRRLKLRSTDRRFLAVVRELAAWRESEAQTRDVPRNRIIKDEQILDIAAHRPQSTEQLARTRGLNQNIAKGRIGQEILDAVKTGLAVREDERPSFTPKADLPHGLGPLVELLKVLLKMTCERHKVAQKLVASSADLERMAADDDAQVPALTGWRREVFGEHALALKHGRIALSGQGTEIKVVPIAP